MLILDALDDHFANPEHVRRLASQIPNARLRLVRDGGHFVIGHRDEVTAEITEFLRTSVPEHSEAFTGGHGEGELDAR